MGDPNSHSAFSGLNFFISLISNILFFTFGSKDTLLNPAISQPLWDGLSQLPYVGPIILAHQDKVTPQLLLVIVSFVVIWLALATFVKLFGGVFKSFTPLLLMGVGVLIAGFMLGAWKVDTVTKLLSGG